MMTFSRNAPPSPSPWPSPWPMAVLVAMLLVISTTACSPRPEPLAPLAADAIILAFGDSLTAGTGAGPSESFPARLAELTGRRVINAGVPGEISSEGLARLPAVLDAHNPALLILTHGGNDMLRRTDPAQTRDNLLRMARLARTRDIDVVLVAVPAPAVLRLRSDGMYAEVAADLGIPIEDRALAHILSRNPLKADPIHPNADGYRYLAESLRALLESAGAL